MPRPITLAAAAAAVVASTLLATVAVPGVLADPSARDPVRPGPVRLNDVSIAEGAVGGETATLRVESRLSHAGPPAEDVAVEFRAVDDDSGLLETTETVRVGTVAGEGETAVRANLTVRREGSYRIETVVYRNRTRVDAGGRTVGNLAALRPDYARTGVGFTRSAVVPPVSVAVADASGVANGSGPVRLDVAASLTNRGDAPSGDLRVELVARQADSNLVADRTTLAPAAIRPGRTAEASGELTVPDGYNYRIDAVLTRDGVIVDGARTVVNFDPDERLPENTTVRERELDVSDFEGGSASTAETDAPTDTSGGTPGFGPAVAVVALAGAAGLAARRWAA